MSLFYRILAASTSIFLLVAGASYGANVNLAWDPNAEPDIAGYRVLLGIASGQYTQSVDAGLATTATISGLSPGTTYFFAVTARNTSGFESLPSSEVSYLVPGGPAPTPPPTPTPTPNPTPTPTPTPTPSPTPTPTPTPLPSPSGTFYRAVNLGGPALTIDGNSWQANTSTTTDFTFNGATASNSTVTFGPSLDTIHTTMMRTFRYATNLQLTFTNVASGTYDVYVWVFEYNNSINATLTVNGTTVLPSYNTGAAGHWDRLGPYRTTVSNGTLSIGYLCNTPGDQGLLSGLEVWRVDTPTPTPTPTPAPTPAALPGLLNVSTRGYVQTGENVLIGGVIISGDTPKRVVLRAIGPSLAAAGVSGALPDPMLSLHDSTGAAIAANDNWRTDGNVEATGLAPSNDLEAAIVTMLAPGAYTAVVSGAGGSTGNALFEIYDVDRPNSRIVNISTRGRVETGDNIMIGGFIIGGDQPSQVVLRALGPSLAAHGIAGALANPTLELYNDHGDRIYANDDWRSDQGAQISAVSLAPSDERESAIIATLPPGNYTAIVGGTQNSTGVSLVEVYNLTQ